MSNTAFIYNELLQISGDLAKTITAVEDFPPYNYDGNNEQLAHDLNQAKKTIDNARRYIATASALTETTEPVNNWNVNEYMRAGGSLFDAQTDELQFYYMDGTYTERVRNIIKKDIHPDEITYFIHDENKNIVWEGFTATDAQAALKELEPYGDGFQIRSAKQTFYYNGLMVDFDDVLNRAVDYAITNTNDDIYGNVAEFIVICRKAARAFTAAEITERITGITDGPLTVKLR